MIQPKFKIGQKVYGVSHRMKTKQVHVNCDVCKSTGLVQLNEKNYCCPACNGYMETKHYGLEYYISYPKAEVGRVQITEYMEGYGYQSSVEYMLVPTGIGSGQIWHENRLFATESEANNFCNTYMPSDNYGTYSVLKPVDPDEYL